MPKQNHAQFMKKCRMMAIIGVIDSCSVKLHYIIPDSLYETTSAVETPFPDFLVMNLNYRQFAFLTSAPKNELCPIDEGAEVAFAGRSNAGKSSAINALTDNKKLARTSKTPGRTQLINFFSQIPGDGLARLVDLPGYGYAKVPMVTKLNWQKHLNEYLEKRQSLRALVLVMDIRQPFREFDQMLINWASENGMPLHVLLTKSDKVKSNQARQVFFEAEKKLSDHALISVQLFSAAKKQGIDVLQGKLNNWLIAAQ